MHSCRTERRDVVPSSCASAVLAPEARARILDALLTLVRILRAEGMCLVLRERFLSSGLVCARRRICFAIARVTGALKEVNEDCMVLMTTMMMLLNEEEEALLFGQFSAASL
eukprot:CAMPEP_0196742652 /NCGR_PEP_ID=MMETSP1091-20130531/48130_1 /TAXON_ID=302021 /ORGANISM="Rhodomonas sp., Strain CCMP768" /LENGTH=111 /DNA_ID=CAMNT_0042088767 /DNA_START=132 /DNA_END=464 /DNA_ORIENTATION=+